MPDFFQGEALPISLYPPDTEEKRAVAKEFMATKADVGKNVGKLLEVVKEGKERWGHVRKWGGYGLCWGGKMVVLVSGEGTPFLASGQAHPGYFHPGVGKCRGK